MPFEKLPERTVEAVCILTSGSDQWGAAYGSFILANQAGLDIEFQYGSQPLKDSKLYLIPSASGMTPLLKPKWLEMHRIFGIVIRHAWSQGQPRSIIQSEDMFLHEGGQG